MLSMYLSVENEAVLCYYLMTEGESCLDVTNNLETIRFI